MSHEVDSELYYQVVGQRNDAMAVIAQLKRRINALQDERTGATQRANHEKKRADKFDAELLEERECNRLREIYKDQEITELREKLSLAEGNLAGHKDLVKNMSDRIKELETELADTNRCLRETRTYDKVATRAYADKCGLTYEQAEDHLTAMAMEEDDKAD